MYADHGSTLAWACVHDFCCYGRAKLIGRSLACDRGLSESGRRLWHLLIARWRLSWLGPLLLSCCLVSHWRRWVTIRAYASWWIWARSLCAFWHAHVPARPLSASISGRRKGRILCCCCRSLYKEKWVRRWRQTQNGDWANCELVLSV